ncbi:hypothetical protein C9402_18780 [Xanthomonas vasicola pv. vasculorum]|nr:hypothetical protein C9402_18780 [Xanthomonas vasicola pv. vasculorum]
MIGTFSLVRAFYFIRSVYHSLLTRFWGEGAAGSAMWLFLLAQEIGAEPVGEGRKRPSPGGRSCDRSAVGAQGGHGGRSPRNWTKLLTLSASRSGGDADLLLSALLTVLSTIG